MGEMTSKPPAEVATPLPPEKPMNADQLCPTTAAAPAAAATHSGEPGGPAR